MKRFAFAASTRAKRQCGQKLCQPAKAYRARAVKAEMHGTSGQRHNLFSTLKWPLAFVLLAIVAQGAGAQTLTTYNSQAAYTAALPATGVVSRVETFSSVSSDYSVPQSAGDSWSGFKLSATGTSQFGSAIYCVNLAVCMNWTASAPASAGVFGAVGELQAGTFTFTTTGRAVAFGLDYWDWNDVSQRSAIRVTLSNGATRIVTGPSTIQGDPGGFIGFQLDAASIYAGIKIASVTWYALPSQSEIIGIKNVRISEAVPELQVTKVSQIWTPSAFTKFFLPANEVVYEITVANRGLANPDANSVLVVDVLPSGLSFWNGDIDAGGADTNPMIAPVGFSQANGASMTFNPSTDFGVTYGGAAPTSYGQCSSLAMDGSFRADVRYLCLRPNGILPASANSPAVTFTFRARIQ